MFSFLSIEFSLFFIGFFALYWLLIKKPQWQNVLLTLASYFIVYLMAGTTAITILAIFSGIIFLLSLAIYFYPYFKRTFLTVGILATIAQLSFFKYYEFFRENIQQSLAFLQLDSSGLAANIIFPLGISYYSFQAISYLVNLYTQKHPLPPLTLSQLFTHFSFFATISAGPIARTTPVKELRDIQGQPTAMLEQLQQTQPRRLLFPLLALGLILLALVKKWWLAGWLADEWVNPVFSNPMQYHSLEVLTAIYGYTLQLFLDFSGYSEMMVAFGLLLGFRLPMNFNAPLLAHNIRNFWDRWHISLSTWIRDYIYIPLGGSRKGFWRTQINLLIAMGLSGIWHGSSWNFLFWGLLHGIAIILLNCGDKLYHQFNPDLDAREARNVLAKSGRLGKIIGTIVTIHFVCFCFVFFRATTLDEAINVFTALVQNTQTAWTQNPLFLLTILLLSWIAYPFVRQWAGKLKPIFQRIPAFILAGLLFIGFITLIIFAPSGIPGFIYANF